MLTAASGAAAQSSDLVAPLADIGDGVASVGRDAVRATDAAATAVHDGVEDAWAATISREPPGQLKVLPSEARRAPKPKLALRPSTTETTAKSGGKQHALSGIASYY